MKQLFHPWDKWECYPAGFYENRPVGRNISEGTCKFMYAQFLRDIPRFEAALAGVIRDWPNSCEQYLSNERMNRIAWLGQAAMCYATGVPAVFCGGYNQLSEREMWWADTTALDALNHWLQSRGEPAVSLLAAIQSQPVYIHKLGGLEHGENTPTNSAHRPPPMGGGTSESRSATNEHLRNHPSTTDSMDRRTNDNLV